MKRTKKKNKLVWMDLEMTGLDPKRDRVIEIATVITDHHLNVLATGPELVLHASARVLGGMDRWNRRQHRKSGVTEEVQRSKIDVAEAERKTLRFLKRHCAAKTSRLCGNVIHHDRQFLAKWMPELDAFLSYRHIDVSTVQDLVARWHPKRKKFPRKKKKAHRALADVLESIEQLRFYRKRYFK